MSKVWFITGASGGFGSLWAEAALARGDRVAATARDRTALGPLIDRYGESVLSLTVDVNDRDAVFAAVARTAEHFGRLDVVVCAAGYGLFGAIEEISEVDARANIETNVFGTLAVIQAALPIMRAQGSGHILPVSSLGGVVALPMFFQATKFAIEGIGEALAAEVRDFGVRVTIIEPGGFDTGFFGGAAKQSATIAAYDPVRAWLGTLMEPGSNGKPEATAQALLAAIDADDPPLRLVLGSTALPAIRQAYAERLTTWAEWEDISNAAQG